MLGGDDGQGDCDYDGNGRASGSEIAAHKAATARSWASQFAWNVLGVLNTMLEDERSADILMVLASGRGKVFGEIPAPKSFRGLPMSEAHKMVPEGWQASPTRSGGGTRYSNPAARGQQIRIMPGNPNDPNPVKKGPYVRVSTGRGKPSDPIPLEGNPTLP